VFYSDGIGRHLVCTPFSIENLHRMAEHLRIGRHFFHSSSRFPHYDIPKRRMNEIIPLTIVVTTRVILKIVKGAVHSDR
jgi:hypothetical protein